MTSRTWRLRCLTAARSADSAATTATPESSGEAKFAAPVRGHTTGIAQSTQLYLSQLVRSMGDTPAESRTILFTDSRDDAARTAAGVARNHFRDLVRQLIRQVMDERPPAPLSVLRKAVASPGSLNDSEQYIFRHLSR